jgi:hypothetical protein
MATPSGSVFNDNDNGRRRHVLHFRFAIADLRFTESDILRLTVALELNASSSKKMPPGASLWDGLG